MPTGYTADVANGKITELKPFAMQLARGMGALIIDAPIPERFEPSRYHAEKLIDLRAERDRLRALTSEEAQAAADAEYAEFEAARDQAEQRHTDQLNRYNAMIAKVIRWQGAPEGIKEFALEQLRTGRDFDCRGPFKFYRQPPERDGVAWRESSIAEVLRQIDYHATEDAKERERADSRTSWLKQLRASLAAAETAEAAE